MISQLMTVVGGLLAAILGMFGLDVIDKRQASLKSRKEEEERARDMAQAKAQRDALNTKMASEVAKQASIKEALVASKQAVTIDRNKAATMSRDEVLDALKKQGF